MRKRPVWLTLIGLVVLLAIAVFGVQLPDPVRQAIETATGVKLPGGEQGPQLTKVHLSGLPDTPDSFGAAKRLLYEQIYAGHQQTFYCGCTFGKDRRVSRRSCGVKVRQNEKRANRIEAEHVFPASDFGRQRECWRKPICKKSDGTPFKGRRCCEEADPIFKTAHNDLHNLYPAVGEINGDRSNYRWGMVEGEPRLYGRCDFEVDRSIDRAEPPERVQGDIARTYFYMSETYGLRLSDQQQKLFEAWSQQDPPDDWERERNQRIAQIQGRGNRFIE